MTEVSDIPLNTAVCWNGTRFGLLATIPEEAERIVEKGDVVVSTLLAAMADPSRFVMAHVLLTRMTGVQYESFPSWNGLKVDLQAQGKVSIDSDQRHKLARRWQLYFRTEPRPDKLPSSN